MTERWKPSVTVAAVVEQVADGVSRYLLVEEHTPEGLQLNNPAGHLDPGESLQQAVVREALEETGRVFTPDRVVGVYLSRFQRPARGEDVTYLRVAFGGQVGERDKARPLDEGIVRTVWLTYEEVEASRARHRSPLVMRCIADHAAGKRYPLELLSAYPSIAAPPLKGGGERAEDGEVPFK
jgi:8-oxo-dGTP pyrophosphatase MutT (NUDIX family)